MTPCDHRVRFEAYSTASAYRMHCKSTEFRAEDGPFRQLM